MPEKNDFGASSALETGRIYGLSAEDSTILRLFSAEKASGGGRYESADAANSPCLSQPNMILKNQEDFGTACAYHSSYPAALWFGKASVERRIHSLQEDDPISCNIPQFSSSFCPRTLLTAQRAFLCAVPGMVSCMMDIQFRRNSMKFSA